MRSSEPVSRRGHRQSTPATTAGYPSESHRRQQHPYHAVKKAAPAPLHPILEVITRKLESPLTWNSMTPYVVQGLGYFLRHSQLWKISLCPIIWALLFAIAAFCVLLPLAFVPQGIALSTVMTPWLGWPLAFLLALVEYLIVIMIFAALVLIPITDKLFDEVLILRGHAALVAADNCQACCGCCSIVGVLALICPIITLPLNLIPVVGTVLWLFINGRLKTWDSHSHYHYELKNRNFRAQCKFVSEHWYSYHMFGMQAMALEMIPFANVFFMFTNTVGAALWAADMEDRLLEYDSGNNNNTTGDNSTNKVSVASTEAYPTEETNLTP